MTKPKEKLGNNQHTNNVRKCYFDFESTATWHYRFVIKRAQFCSDLVESKDLITHLKLKQIQEGDTITYMKDGQACQGIVERVICEDIRDICKDMYESFFDDPEEGVYGRLQIRRKD